MFITDSYGRRQEIHAEISPADLRDLVQKIAAAPAAEKVNYRSDPAGQKAQKAIESTREAERALRDIADRLIQASNPDVLADHLANIERYVADVKDGLASVATGAAQPTAPKDAPKLADIGGSLDGLVKHLQGQDDGPDKPLFNRRTLGWIDKFLREGLFGHSIAVKDFHTHGYLHGIERELKVLNAAMRFTMGDKSNDFDKFARRAGASAPPPVLDDNSARQRAAAELAEMRSHEREIQNNPGVYTAADLAPVRDRIDSLLNQIDLSGATVVLNGDGETFTINGGSFNLTDAATVHGAPPQTPAAAAAGPNPAAIIDLEGAERQALFENAQEALQRHAHRMGSTSKDMAHILMDLAEATEENKQLTNDQLRSLRKIGTHWHFVSEIEKERVANAIEVSEVSGRILNTLKEGLEVARKKGEDTTKLEEDIGKAQTQHLKNVQSITKEMLAAEPGMNRRMRNLHHKYYMNWEDTVIGDFAKKLQETFGKTLQILRPSNYGMTTKFDPLEAGKEGVKNHMEFSRAGTDAAFERFGAMGSQGTFMNNIDVGSFDIKEFWKNGLQTDGGRNPLQDMILDSGKDVQRVFQETGVKAEIVQKTLMKTFAKGTKSLSDWKNITKQGLALGRAIGADAEATADTLYEWHQNMQLTGAEASVVARHAQMVGRMTGVTGDNLLQAVKSAGELATKMKNTGTYTSETARNLIGITASAKKFGVEGMVGELMGDLSNMDSFMKMDPAMMSLMARAAQAGNLDLSVLQTGEALKGDNARKMGEGIEEVIRQIVTEFDSTGQAGGDLAKLKGVDRQRAELTYSRMLKGRSLGEFQKAGQSFIRGNETPDKAMRRVMEESKAAQTPEERMEKRLELIELQKAQKESKATDLASVIADVEKFARYGLSDQAIRDQNNGKFETAQVEIAKRFESLAQGKELTGSLQDNLKAFGQNAVDKMMASDLGRQQLEQTKFNLGDELAKAAQKPGGMMEYVAKINAMSGQAEALAKSSASPESKADFILQNRMYSIQEESRNFLEQIVKRLGTFPLTALETGAGISSSLNTVVQTLGTIGVWSTASKYLPRLGGMLGLGGSAAAGAGGVGATGATAAGAAGGAGLASGFLIPAAVLTATSRAALGVYAHEMDKWSQRGIDSDNRNYEDQRKGIIQKGKVDAAMNPQLAAEIQKVSEAEEKMKLVLQKANEWDKESGKFSVKALRLSESALSWTGLTGTSQHDMDAQAHKELGDAAGLARKQYDDAVKALEEKKKSLAEPKPPAAQATPAAQAAGLPIKPADGTPISVRDPGSESWLQKIHDHLAGESGTATPTGIVRRLALDFDSTGKANGDLGKMLPEDRKQAEFVFSRLAGGRSPDAVQKIAAASTRDLPGGRTDVGDQLRRDRVEATGAGAVSADELKGINTNTAKAVTTNETVADLLRQILGVLSQQAGGSTALAGGRRVTPNFYPAPVGFEGVPNAGLPA